MTKKLLALAAILFLLVSCAPQQVQQTDIAVSLIADGTIQQLTLPAGSNVQKALDQAGVSLAQTDRVDPPAYSLLKEGGTVTVTRVKEEFETKQVVVPYERQELHNESMPAGETRVVQAGQNGLDEVTIRHVYENGIETDVSDVSRATLQAAIPEIVMIGVQSPFAPLAIAGKLAYLTGGNAWVMDQSTSNRVPLVTTGDLDGHIFSLSSNGNWLLFTRKSKKQAGEEINTLWVVRTDGQSIPVNLRVSNVVLFARFIPGATDAVIYSTAEPRPEAPGWKANNDLLYLNFSADGPVGQPRAILEGNSTGYYAWWGTTFAFSQNGQLISYAQANQVGLVDAGQGAFSEHLKITPYATYSNWVWIPGMAWAPDNNTLFLVTHALPDGSSGDENSTQFDLTVLDMTTNQTKVIVPDTGMFAYPAVSPLQQSEAGLSYRLAYLQAVSSAQSATSRYRLAVVEPNGVNPRVLFPAEGRSGLEPQTPVWAPQPADQDREYIAIINQNQCNSSQYRNQGNLWLVDSVSGEAQQITGDCLTSQIDWK